MVWQSRLAAYVNDGRERLWQSPSRYGRAGLAARGALQRVVRPVLAREADAHELIERTLGEQRLESRLTAIAMDPAAAADSVAVETDVGVLLMHAHDEVMTPAIATDGHWEAEESAWLRAVLRRGDTVVDCGANVGYFSLLASRAVGPGGAVVAVEPDRDNLRLLRANLWRNGCDNVLVLPMAAHNQRGLLALRRNPTNAGDHQVHAAAGAGDVLVACMALDEVLANARVQVIKIDTQGVDHLVVDGLRRTLAGSPGAQALVEFWVEGMAERGIDPHAVLAGYRSLGRPLCVLGAEGAATAATDDEIVAAAQAAPGLYINVVLGPVG